VRERIVKLRQEKYAGFNDQHFSEKLCEVEQIPFRAPVCAACCVPGSAPRASGVPGGIGNGGSVRRKPG
jgi:hypothetical protein